MVFAMLPDMRPPLLIFPPIRPVKIRLFGRRRLQPWNTKQQELEQRALAAVSGGIARLLPAVDERPSGAVTDPPFPTDAATLFDDHLEHLKSIGAYWLCALRGINSPPANRHRCSIVANGSSAAGKGRTRKKPRPRPGLFRSAAKREDRSRSLHGQNLTGSR